VDEIALLAITHSPDLATARADVRMAEAQAMSAGLPPDPQLALGVDRVMGQAPGTTFAYSAGLTFDLAALLSLDANRALADAELQRARLDLRWQAWQVVAKARLLFVKVNSASRLQALLDADRQALGARLESVHGAVKRRLISTDQAAPLQAAYDDATRQSFDVERQRNQAVHDLDAMVGVAPDVELKLVGDVATSALTDDDVRGALERAPHERPDLLALRMALEVQDDKYRAALRAQFPAITIGPTRARDTSNVNTWGVALGITLPLFNRNWMRIASSRTACSPRRRSCGARRTISSRRSPRPVRSRRKPGSPMREARSTPSR
jgi:outer membrane protein TolC